MSHGVNKSIGDYGRASGNGQSHISGTQACKKEMGVAVNAII